MFHSPRSAPKTALKDTRTAIVTGVSGGIGTIVAKALLDEGYHVVGLSRTHPTITHDSFTFISFDASQAVELEQSCENIASYFASVSVLVHCAAIIAPANVETMGADDVLRQISINLTMPAVLTSKLLSSMGKGSRIVFVNSMAAAMPLAGSSIYSATKAGLRNFALSLSQEVHHRGISVSSIFPGAVLTEMLRQEMASGGSVLNFVSCPATPHAVAREIVSLINKPRQERFFPALDGIFGGLCMLMPALLRISMPVLTYFGKRGYARAIRKNIFQNKV
ncbi:SDR family NAD(P)-dependent oxidoreductase [Gluconobacter sp. NFX36]|uniref:SDR family NAD(P)-dependent oxidoreductase n=1 Tax=Gluconobacter TaxID=441 RepID=UPI000550D054